MRKITCYFLLWLCSVEQVFATIQADTVVSPEVQARINENYGKLPLRFEANEGQIDGPVKFLSRGSGYSMLFGPAETVMVLNKSAAAHSPQPTAHSPQP